MKVPIRYSAATFQPLPGSLPRWVAFCVPSALRSPLSAVAPSPLSRQGFPGPATRGLRRELLPGLLSLLLVCLWMPALLAGQAHQAPLPHWPPPSAASFSSPPPASLVHWAPPSSPPAPPELHHSAAGARFWLLASLAAATTAADIEATQSCLGKGGCIEANPLMPTRRAQVYAFQIPTFLAIAWISHHFATHGHRGLAIVPLFSLIAIHTAGTALAIRANHAPGLSSP